MTVSSLPQTTNTLSHDQRSRLIRSTRKLGAILGTTPYLVDSSGSVSQLSKESIDESDEHERRKSVRTSRREGMIFPRAASVGSSLMSSHSMTPSELFSSYGSSSLSIKDSVRDYSADVTLRPRSASPACSLLMADLSSSDEDSDAPPTGSKAVRIVLPGLSPKRSRKAPPAPLQLKLTLDPTAVSASDEYLPFSPTSSRQGLTSPILFLTPKTSTTKQRRQKMSKVCRTLGENVPPELIFPPASYIFDNSPFRDSSRVYKQPRRPPIPTFRTNEGAPTVEEDDSADDFGPNLSIVNAADKPSIGIFGTPHAGRWPSASLVALNNFHMPSSSASRRSHPPSSARTTDIVETPTTTTISPITFAHRDTYVQADGRFQSPQTPDWEDTRDVRLTPPGSPQTTIERSVSPFSITTRTMTPSPLPSFMRDEPTLETVTPLPILPISGHSSWRGAWNVEDMTEVKRALRALKTR